MQSVYSGLSSMGSKPKHLITADHIRELVIGQKNNKRFYIIVLCVALFVSIGLFAYLATHALLKSVGPVLGNLITFVAGVIPAKEWVACDDRIRGLNIKADILKNITPGTDEAKRIEELLWKDLEKLP